MADFKECRSSDLVAQADDKRIISGYALIWGTASNLMKSSDGKYFYETITPEALTEQFLYTQDVRCYYNHDENSLLARFNKGKGTLSLTVDETGLFYSFKAKESPLDEQVYQSIKCGDVTGSSFAFSIAAGGEIWKQNNDRTYTRTITKFARFYDVSPVNVPAYDSSNVSARHMETGTETANFVNEESKRNQDLDLYYLDLKYKLYCASNNTPYKPLYNK